MSRRQVDTLLFGFVFTAQILWVLQNPDEIIRRAKALTSYLAWLNAEAHKPLCQWGG